MSQSISDNIRNAVFDDRLETGYRHYASNALADTPGKSRDKLSQNEKLLEALRDLDIRDDYNSIVKFESITEDRSGKHVKIVMPYADMDYGLVLKTLGIPQQHADCVDELNQKPFMAFTKTELSRHVVGGLLEKDAPGFLDRRTKLGDARHHLAVMAMRAREHDSGFRGTHLMDKARLQLHDAHAEAYEEHVTRRVARAAKIGAYEEEYVAADTAIRASVRKDYDKIQDVLDRVYGAPEKSYGNPKYTERVQAEEQQIAVPHRA